MDFAFGDQLGGFLHVAAGSPDGTDYLKLPEDYFWQGHIDVGPTKLAQED